MAMFCSNCRMDYPNGAVRCDMCMGWLRAKRKPGEEAPAPAWLNQIETLDPGPSHQQKLEAVLATPKRQKAKRGTSAVLIHLLLISLVGLASVGGYRAWEAGRMPTLTGWTGQSLDPQKLAQENLDRARAAMAKKDWPEALRRCEAALPLASPAQQAEACRLQAKSERSYADTLAQQAQTHLERNQWEQARKLSRQALALYDRLPGCERQRASMVALEGRIWRREGERVLALSAFKRAHQLDPKGGYAELVRSLPPAPAAVGTSSEPTPEVVLSLGDTPAYPSGQRVARRASASAAPAPTAPVPVKKSRASTYVPTAKPKSRLNADVLPSYNDGK